MILLGSAIFLTTLAVDLFTDVRRRKTGKSVNHLRGALLRLIGFIPACYYMQWYSAPTLLFSYIFLFNGLYNTFTGNEWGYIGKSAWADKQLRKYPALVPVINVGVVVTFFSYIIILKH